MPAAARIDLFAIPEDQRDAVAALLRENSDLKGETVSLKEIVQRLEHLVAELNHVVHGKKSEKLSEERANGTPMVRETLASDSWPSRISRRRSPKSRRRKTRKLLRMKRRAGKRPHPSAIAAIFPRACRGSSRSSSPTA